MTPVFDRLAGLGRRFADLAYECSGSGAGLRNALELIKPAGAVAEVGIPGKEVPIDVSGQIVFKEKTIVGCRAFYHSTWDKTMELLKDCGAQAEKLITHRLALKDFAQGIDLITSGECLKVVVCPSEG